MERILITGAAGFIGSHLTERMLEAGWAVMGLDAFSDFYDPALKRRNLRRALVHDRFELVEMDIRDAEGLNRALGRFKPQAVVHLAALAGVRPSVERADVFCDVNVTGTTRVLEAAARHGVKRFLFGSSSSVYGNNQKVPFAEADPVNEPISPYAATKRAGELMAHTYAHLHGLSVACLRFFTVYGPRQRPDLAIGKFMRTMAANETIGLFGDGSTSRDYTFIDDILDGLVAALEKTERFGLYNLGSHHPIRLNDLIVEIEKATGLTARTEFLPTQPGDVRRTYADLSHSQAELGYEPRVALAEGLQRQWQWLRSDAVSV
ncbi:MAG: GDP-mannose 4,6-dehydratase [Phycisphaeraceae bacterium]|nr:GDP-mannose 4,6-dehydratase [Phycisphaeraceae bacterium]